MAMGSPPSMEGESDIIGETRDDRQDRVTGLPADIRKIGRHSILNKIGEGGMGVVYAAYDEQLDRRIAIKVLTTEQPGSRARTRIMREAQAMAKLSHPNVVQVYETGEIQGHIYLAMEFVKGGTLGDWIDAAPRTLLERLEIVMQAGEGLQAAHEAGLIHRDFKPDNVMVGEGNRVKVLDFGLARSHEDAEENLSNTMEQALPERSGNVLSDELTQFGAIMGTPMYMSPEQHYGLPTDVASDQFNFCVVLYEALYGERPFAGENRVALAYATRQGQIRPAPPESKVPPKWREIILRGLKTEPQERWPSMRALLDELRREAFPPDRRLLYILGGVAGVAVMVAGVLAAVLVFGGPTEAELSEVQKLAESARLAASRAHWVYPADGAPDDTSLLYVTALHDLEGDLDGEGEEKAVALSQEFASTLVRLGDQYWEAEGGKIFARDFYAQAVMFDPSLELAKERSGFLQVELADLRERAKTGDFSDEEIAAASELAELAEPMLDEEAAAPAKAALEERVAKVKKKARKRRKNKSHSQVDEPGELVADAVPAAAVEPDPLDGDETGGEELEGEETGEEEDPLAIPPNEMDRGQARAAAKALVKEAKVLKRKGKRDAALKKLYQATKIDRRYAPAWDSLRDIHFQIGAYQEAANYGEKAVKNASRNGKYHLRLGEAYWKLKDYDQAEASWKTAQSLGVDQATARLQALRKKLGR
jgi:tetratricopeptide (TPR) repeat protein/predicted Ser/Thr protein kinase